MAYANIENLTKPGTSLKRNGKRKKRRFKVNARKRGYTPQVFEGAGPGFLSDYVKQLPEHSKATTARNNDGMSYVW